jgi:hypothetical protein
LCSASLPKAARTAKGPRSPVPLFEGNDEEEIERLKAQIQDLMRYHVDTQLPGVRSLRAGPERTG